LREPGGLRDVGWVREPGGGARFARPAGQRYGDSREGVLVLPVMRAPGRNLRAFSP
jgi:hypothetical protein